MRLALAINAAYRFGGSRAGRRFSDFGSAQAGRRHPDACHYEITILNPAKPIRAVWVIFDQGRDMLRYYGDPDVQTFAYREDLALLLPFHCRAKGYEDMDVDPPQGIARALFTALEQSA